MGNYYLMITESPKLLRRMKKFEKLIVVMVAQCCEYCTNRPADLKDGFKCSFVTSRHGYSISQEDN